VVTLEPTVFLEVNSAALGLSSEEVQEQFNKALIARVLDRLAEADKALAQHGARAVTADGGAVITAATTSAGKFDLELLP
jgi:hypothetical protein